MKCLKCGRLVADALLGTCYSCHVSDVATENEHLRYQNKYLRERVHDLERENWRLTERVNAARGA